MAQLRTLPQRSFFALSSNPFVLPPFMTVYRDSLSENFYKRRMATSPA